MEHFQPGPVYNFEEDAKCIDVAVLYNRIGQTSSERARWSSDTSITAFATLGFSRTKMLSATVLQAFGTLTEILSYNRPEIETLYFTFSAFGIYFKFGIGRYICICTLT